MLNVETGMRLDGRLQQLALFLRRQFVGGIEMLDRSSLVDRFNYTHDHFFMHGQTQKRQSPARGSALIQLN